VSAGFASLDFFSAAKEKQARQSRTTKVEVTFLRDDILNDPLSMIVSWAESRVADAHGVPKERTAVRSMNDGTFKTVETFETCECFGPENLPVVGFLCDSVSSVVKRHFETRTTFDALFLPC
jgi:hypothetical protein